MKIAVLGLGNMGLPMAVNLARAGHDVTGTSLTAPVPAAEDAGVRSTASAAQACADRDVVLCLLPDLPYLEPMLDDVLAGGASTLVVMSTVSPVAVRELAERLAGRVDVLDACLSGGVAKAEDGTLSIMCGGDEEVFERVRPVLDVLGTTITLMGPVGAGALTKACNQLVVAGTLVALAEASLLAERNGLDIGRVLDVLAGGLAASEVLAQKRDKLAASEFSTSGPAKFLVKDLTFALDAADGADLPELALLRRMFVELTDAGLGDLDNSVVLEFLRRRSPQATSK